MPSLQTSQWWRKHPHPRQLEALAFTHVPFMLFGGGRGGGKTEYLIYAATQYAHHPEMAVCIMRRTWGQMNGRGGIFQRIRQIYPDVECVLSPVPTMTFPAGGTIEFRHLANTNAIETVQGLEFTLIGVDEGGTIDGVIIDDLQGSLRTTSDIPPQLRITANPGGRSNDYLRMKYVENDNPDFMFIPSYLDDNPSLPGDYRDRMGNLSGIRRAQWIDGDWYAMKGEFYDAGKLKDVDVMPFEPERIIRFWDFASRDPKTSVDDPDYTAGVKVGYKAGQYVIMDVARTQSSPPETEKFVLETAKKDGTEVPIFLEEERGSSGKMVTSHYSRILAGFIVQGNYVTGSKEDRAHTAASAVSNGNVYIMDKQWNLAFKDELSAFPRGRHRDQADAFAHAVNQLSKPVNKPLIYAPPTPVVN